MKETKLIFKSPGEEDLDSLYSFFSDNIRNNFPYYSKKSKDYLLNKKFTKEVISTSLKDGFGQICLDNSKIVGLLLAFSGPSAGSWELNWIIVDETHRKNGIGGELIRQWEREAILRGVHCLQAQTSNEAEINFYKRQEFVNYGVIPQGTYGNKKYKFYKIIQHPKEENFLRY